MEETIRKILAAAENLAPTIEKFTGTPLITPAIRAGQALLELIDGLKETSGQSQEELQSTRDALEAKINAHVDEVIGRLNG
jgi:hypothetical protein